MEATNYLCSPFGSYLPQLPPEVSNPDPIHSQAAFISNGHISSDSNEKQLLDMTHLLNEMSLQPTQSLNAPVVTPSVEKDPSDSSSNTSEPHEPPVSDAVHSSPPEWLNQSAPETRFWQADLSPQSASPVPGPGALFLNSIHQSFEMAQMRNPSPTSHPRLFPPPARLLPTAPPQPLLPARKARSFLRPAESWTRKST